MAVQVLKLTRGSTGLEAQTGDGALVGHVCHSDQVSDVLDMLRREFPGEFEVWAQNV
ncbi:hypothetical protein ACIBI0_38610 [Microbispora rosea]|uniref:hypothetical protein n=1 Tax=Microbispora rosea TaxID=58117 RepID=UPI00379DD7CB